MTFLGDQIPPSMYDVVSSNPAGHYKHPTGWATFIRFYFFVVLIHQWNDGTHEGIQCVLSNN